MRIASKLALCAALGLGSLATTAQSADFVNVLTGGTSGVYFPLGTAMAKVYGEAMPKTKVTVQSTKASAENLNLLQSGLRAFYAPQSRYPQDFRCRQIGHLHRCRS